jgi:predicted GH43/DUF377 family glycosyl hydrolase
MRGGSPAMRLSDGDETREPYYLSFFHSSIKVNQGILTYFMAAYRFESNPPFAITHISKEPIMHPLFINETIGGWAYKYVDYINFPMGFTVSGSHIYVSYGRNDKDGWILKLDKAGLLDR